MSKTKKIILWIVGVIIAVLAFLWFLGAYGYQIQNYFIQKSQEKYLAQIEENRARLLEAQMNDNYGGKTPEETLDLYITALKAGDIELASKYYEVSIEHSDLQQKELDNLSNIIDNKDINKVIKETENIRYLGVKNILSNGNISFVYHFTTKEETKFIEIVSNDEVTTVIPSGTELKVGNALKLNPYTKVWKIIQ